MHDNHVHLRDMYVCEMSGSMCEADSDHNIS